MGTGRPHVVVVGAGMIGASIAYHLALRGARVTVLERDRIGAGATGSSFAWANATFGKEPRSYFELHRRSLEQWRALAERLGPPLAVRFGGTVEWQPPGQAAVALEAALCRHHTWGGDARQVDELELRRLVPGLEPGPVGAAAFSPGEATVDPVAATRALLQASGAELRSPCTLRSVDVGGPGARAVTDAGDVACDRVVLACGIDAPALARELGVDLPLVESLGALAHTRPFPPLFDSVVLAPGAHVLQRPDGRFVIGTDFGGAPVETVRATTAAELLAAAGRFLPALAGATVERLTIGCRVLPADGLPIVGAGTDGSRVVVVAMHSGVSLAPIVGRLVAGEVLDGVEAEELAPYRPARFAAPDRG